MKLITRLFLSFAIVLAVGASSVSAAKALLSDQVTLTANAFSTGTVDLQITTGSGSDYADSHAGFTGTLFAGQTTSKIFKLRNNNSGIGLAIQAQATNVNEGSILPSQVTIAFTPWTTSSVTSGHAEDGAITTSDTLAHWQTPKDLGAPVLPSNGIQYYKMDVSIDQNVTTAGASSFDFVFTGTQTTITPTPTP